MLGLDVASNSPGAAGLGSSTPLNHLPSTSGPSSDTPRRLALTVCLHERGQFESRESLRAAPLELGADSACSVGPCALDLCFDAATAMRQLRFLPAKWMASDALQFAIEAGTPDSIAASIASSLLAQLAYEEGDLPSAEHITRQIMRDGELKVPLDALLTAYPLLSQFEAHRSGPLAATRYLVEGERVGEDRECPPLIAVCLRQQVERFRDCGELECARHSLKRLAQLVRRPAVVRNGQARHIAAEYALAQAQLTLLDRGSADAVEVIRRLYHEAADRGDLYVAVQLGMRLVGGQEAVGNTQEASAALLELLRSAMNQGIFQTFIDGGAGVRRLLEKLSLRGGEVLDVTPLLRTLVRRWARNDGKIMPRAARAGASACLLTAREQSVLRSIGQGLSNKGIARKLGIAPETVKSHAKHIFVKLGTQTRAQAVTRAVELGLI